MSSPFGMSFEDVKAQAAANMRADKGQTAPAAAQETNPAAASGQVVAETGKKSWSEIVEKAQRDLAQSADTSAPIMPEPVTQPETSAETETPTNQSFDDIFKNAETSEQKPISFDELFAKAGNQGTSASEPVASAETVMTSSDNMIPQTDHQEVPAAESEKYDFDAMLQQTDASNGVTASAGAATASFNEMLKQTETSKEPTAEQKTTAGSVEISFDNMFPQTAASEKPAEEPETGTETEVPSFEKMLQQTDEPNAAESDTTVKEETVQNEGLTADTEVSENAEEKSATEETTSESAAETAKPEPKKRTRRSGTRKKDVAAEAEKEPLPDTTEDYKVDILGEKKEPPVSQEEDQPLSVESLFTAEEIAAFRADIRAFVRKEFKTAMVGAVKDLLKEFSE